MQGRKTKTSSRVIAMILSVLMVLQNIPVTAFAGDGQVKSNIVEITGEAEETKEATRAEGDEPEMITVTFNPNTEDDGTLANIVIEVAEGSAIGSKLPTVPTVPGYETKWVKEGTTTEVDAETVVTEAFTAVVDKKLIVYKATFLNEDGTTLDIKETSIEQGFAVNVLPDVPPKTNKVGKWVYQGTDTEFPVGTVISSDVTLEPAYEQNIFTVTFMVDNAQYEEMTTATGTTIVLPTAPTKAGMTFMGWFTEEDGQGTEYTATSTVEQDLTLYAYFKEQVRVSFLVKDDDGNVISSKSQYFIDLAVGSQITTMPDDPFVEGKVFDHWEHETSGATVEVGYTVGASFNAIAVFREIETYKLTVHYFYMKDGNEIDIQDQVFELIESDFPYTVNAPTNAVADEITGKPIYYPSQTTITVTKDDFGEGYTLTVRDEYIAPDADYKVGYYLKSLSGSGYELIETVEKKGVKNTRVTPDINSYSYADFENRDENVLITGDASQELKVYYTRRDFTLSYNVGEGEYINAETAPYGTEITLPTDATRAGYTFDGWYTDSACTQSADSPFTLKENTTLYAKWNAAQSEYKIVYMIENANDNDYP